MATPIYKPEIDVRPLPKVRVQAVDVGAPARELAQGTNDLAKATFGLWLDEAKKEEDKKLDDATSAALEYRRKVLEDPDAGVFVTRRGDRAAGVTKEYDAAFKKHLDDVEKTMSTQDQKDRWRDLRAKQEGAVFEQLARFEVEQRNQADDAAADGMIFRAQQQAGSDAVQAAVAQFGRPSPLLPQEVDEDAAFQTSRALVVEGVDRKLAKRGIFDPDTANMARIQALSGMHQIVLKGLLATDLAPVAQKYLQKYRAELDEKVVPDLQKHITDEMGQERSIRAAMQATSSVLPGTSLVDEVASQRYLDKLYTEGQLTAREYEKAHQVANARYEDGKKKWEQTLGRYALQAMSAWENGNPAKGHAPYGNPDVIVPTEVRQWLTNPAHKGGPEVWHTIMTWYRTYHTAAQQVPSLAQQEFEFTLADELTRRRRTGIYRDMNQQQLFKHLTTPQGPSNEPPLTYQQLERLRPLLLANSAPPGPAHKVVGDTSMILEVMKSNGIAQKQPRDAPKGFQVNSPETWPHERPWAFYVELSEHMSSWQTQHPDANDRDRRQEIESKLGELVRDKWKARGFKLSDREVYGFEIDRRGLSRHEYEPAGGAAPPPDGAPPRADLPAGWPDVADTAEQIPVEVARVIADEWRRHYQKRPEEPAPPEEIVKGYNAGRRDPKKWQRLLDVYQLNQQARERRGK